MLKSFAHCDDPQTLMTDAEIMTTTLVAALFFGGNYEKERSLLQDEGLYPGHVEQIPFQSNAVSPGRHVSKLV